jgi:hypothetical protein
MLSVVRPTIRSLFLGLAMCGRRWHLLKSVVTIIDNTYKSYYIYLYILKGNSIVLRLNKKLYSLITRLA